MNLKWDDLKLFLAVHEQGSLSGAARVLKLGQPTLSRRIAELEEALGEALFNRQSHGVSLTAAGQKLLPAAQGMAAWANEVEPGLIKPTYRPEGKVRIAATPGLAFGVVAPLAAKIRQQFPQIQIEVLSGVETLNLVRGEADIALRTQKPSDADLVCIDEITSPLRVYASKSYAAKLPSNSGIAELDWICWPESHDWLRTNKELRAWIPDFKPAFTSDDFIVQMAACKAGVGALILSQVLHNYAGLRELQELDIDLGPTASGNFFMVCHKRHYRLPKVQLVMDYISMEFDYLRQGALTDS